MPAALRPAHQTDDQQSGDEQVSQVADHGLFSGGSVAGSGDLGFHFRFLTVTVTVAVATPFQERYCAGGRGPFDAATRFPLLVGHIYGYFAVEVCIFFLK